MAASFKNQINKHYSSARLNKTQLEKLRQMQAQTNGEFEDTEKTELSFVNWVRTKFKPWQLGGIAASLLLLSLFVGNKGQLSDAIVSEIAYNHNKMAAMEITTSSISDVADYLQKLDFSPITSERFKNDGWELVGGRYCSIQGELAAQLRVKNIATGKVMTLYQSRVPDDLKTDKMNNPKQGLIGFDDGVKVELWQEKGLLMGLAQSDTK